MRQLARLLLVWMFLSQGFSFAGHCICDGSPTTANLINFLQQHRSSEKDLCIDDALLRLEDSVPVPVLTDEQLKVIVRFLDHKRLLSEGEREGFAIRSQSTVGMYLATDILFLAGERSTKFLLPILANQPPGTLRDNASLTWLLIFRDEQDQGVRLLMQDAFEAQNEGVAENLKDAARKIAEKCSSDMKVRCRAALVE